MRIPVYRGEAPDEVTDDDLDDDEAVSPPVKDPRDKVRSSEEDADGEM